jgi:hypothetical protein
VHSEGLDPATLVMAPQPRKQHSSQEPEDRQSPSTKQSKSSNGGNSSSIYKATKNVNGEKQYVCPYNCGKAYRNSNGLTYHLNKSNCAFLHAARLAAEEVIKKSPKTKSESPSQSTTSKKRPLEQGVSPDDVSLASQEVPVAQPALKKAKQFSENHKSNLQELHPEKETKESTPPADDYHAQKHDSSPELSSSPEIDIPVTKTESEDSSRTLVMAEKEPVSAESLPTPQEA